MPRPIWKGNISFGLVNIPVTLFPAEERSELQFHLRDRRNRARIRYERVNEETGKPVPWEDIVKAYDLGEGRVVLLEDEDFKKASVEATQTVDIENFVDHDSIDPLYFDRPYYLVPDRKGQKAYHLLLETLQKTGKTGIAKVVIRTRQYLCALFPLQNVLVLNLLRYKHELRTPADLPIPETEAKTPRVSTAEIDMARKLVSSMSSKWEPGRYKDEYQDALLSFIEKKAKAGGKSVPAQEKPEKKPGGKVIDMMELLKRSMEQKGGGSRRESAEAEKPARAAHAGRTPKKRRAAGGRHS